MFSPTTKKSKLSVLLQSKEAKFNPAQMNQKNNTASLAINKQEENIMIYKYKQQLAELETAKGVGTSVITLLVSAKTSINQVITQMSDRLTKANNIKSCI